MTPDDLREIAAVVQGFSDSGFECARKMGTCPRAEEIKLQAAQYAEWAKGLTDLADNFYAFRASQ